MDKQRLKTYNHSIAKFISNAEIEVVVTDKKGKIHKSGNPKNPDSIWRKIFKDDGVLITKMSVDVIERKMSINISTLGNKFYLKSADVILKCNDKDYFCEAHPDSNHEILISPETYLIINVDLNKFLKV